MIDINDFNKELACYYNDESYKVRDNGAVMRLSNGRKLRPLDNVWTFGTRGKNAYMTINGVFVHRIVATAFHGEAPTSQHIVDHIDTNRQNNRPENLRWLSRLENVLKNPITRARIENICGSIEKFLEDPSILQQYGNVDPNFKWMHAVTPEEAQVSKKLLLEWAQYPTPSKGGKLGDWIYKDKPFNFPISYEEFMNTNGNDSTLNDTYNKELDSKSPINEIKEKPPLLFPSLTTNAAQVNWKIPSEFPCCPNTISDMPIFDYVNNLKKDAIFTKNNLYGSKVVDYEVTDNKIYILCESIDNNPIKPWSFAIVSYKDGIFEHESGGTFFEENGARKYMTLAQGKDWTGGEVFDDYC